MKNFVLTESDFDIAVETRTIIGRLTRARKKLILNYVLNFNELHSAPYGVSPNGYPYRCGHDYDCCGCLSSDSMRVLFYKHRAVITHSQHYNY